MVASLKVVSGFASYQKRPSISTLLADPAGVKQKRNGFEKMGRVSDRVKSPIEQCVYTLSGRGPP
jgi:hypothetical protein